MELCECAESDKKRVRLSLRAKRDGRNAAAAADCSKLIDAASAAEATNASYHQFSKTEELSTLSNKRYLSSNLFLSSAIFSKLGEQSLRWGCRQLLDAGCSWAVDVQILLSLLNSYNKVVPIFIIAYSCKK